MLTWMGFVGKIIDLMLNKIAGKRIDLTLDEKKSAAKAFVRFHEAVVTLEQILASFLTYIESFIEDRNSKIYRVHLTKRVTADLIEASREFVNSLKALGKALYFYDKNLAALFGDVIGMKMGMLFNVYSFFEQSVRLEIEAEQHDTAENESFNIPDEDVLSKGEQIPIARFRSVNAGGPFCAIEYTIPSDTLMNLNFEDKLNQTMDLYNDKEYWDDFGAFSDSVMTIIKSNIDGGYIGYEDKDKLIALYPKLKAHKELLTKARESLREFIQKQFSLTDILYVTK